MKISTYMVPMLHCSPVSYLPSYNILFCFFQNLVCSLHNSLDDGFHASERLDKTFIQKEFPHLHPMFPPPESYIFFILASHKHLTWLCVLVLFLSGPFYLSGDFFVSCILCFHYSILFYSSMSEHNSKVKNTIIQKITESPTSKYDALQVKCKEFP